MPHAVAPGLRELQRQMAQLLHHPEQLETAAGAETAATLWTTPPRGTLATRLHAHADGYPARVQEALAEIFPAFAHVIGTNALAALTQRYLHASMPASYNLNDAGAALPDFLHQDALTTTLPFLPDLARLEWHVARAFHAREDAPLDPAPLAAWSLEQWDRAVLRFQSSVALICSEWPIREIWAARFTPVEEIDIDLRQRPDRVVVRRAGLEVHCESVEVHEAAILAALLAGHTLGETSQMLEGQGDDPDSISVAFARWMSLGMITGILRKTESK